MLSLVGASLSFGERILWSELSLQVQPGEFIAVIGANGSGKTSLLKVILGQQRLTAGSVQLLGKPVRKGNPHIGYIPQQKLASEGIPLRARDLIALGINGQRWGVPFPSRARRQAVDNLLAEIGAEEYAEVPLGLLSGGEQQRLRLGQALAGNPSLLLCDEPLLSLDLNYQRLVSDLIDRQRKQRDLAVLFVTHDVNPVLTMVDRILYLAEGKFQIGTPNEVLRSDVLSELYGSPIDVIRTRGRVIVVGTPEGTPGHPHTMSAHHEDEHNHQPHHGVHSPSLRRGVL